MKLSEYTSRTVFHNGVILKRRGVGERLRAGAKDGGKDVKTAHEHNSERASLMSKPPARKRTLEVFVFCSLESRIATCWQLPP